MTIPQWNAAKERLNKVVRDAYQARDTSRYLEALRLRNEHDAFRPLVVAETQRIKEANRAKDAARKAGVTPIVTARANEDEWLRAERRYEELAALERLMGHRTGVNVGHPGY